jgi:RHS repeat-associated protein
VAASRTLLCRSLYNGDGVRMGKTVPGDTTDYVLDLAPTLPVVISDTQAVYLYGLDIVAQQQAERLYYAHDGLGSVRQLLDATGQIETNYAYDPFGVPLVEGEVYNPYQYTGEPWDAEVGLLYLRARYYQPEVGRFITKDPWAGDVSRPGTLNRYPYVQGNPVRVGDASGLQEPVPRPVPEPRPAATPRGAPPVSAASLTAGAAACRIGAVSGSVTPYPRTYLDASHPGFTLLRQESFASQPHLAHFEMLHCSTPFEVSLVVGVALSRLEVTANIYSNGVLLDISDTYDTSGLEPFRHALAFEPKLYRTVEVPTAHGLIAAALYPDGPPVAYETVKKRDFPVGIPIGHKGKGRLLPGLWFWRFEGWPQKVIMQLVVSELASSGLAKPTYSYELNLPYSRTDPEGRNFAREAPTLPRR